MLPVSPDGRRRGGGAVTVREVAAAAGVSPMTVSRVVNADPRVRDTTRAAVRAAMADLNYRPNLAAQSLAGADRIRLGLLYNNPSASYLSEFLLGGLDQVARSNVSLAVEKCGDDDACAAAQRLIDDRVDGVILPPPLSDVVVVVALLAASGVPTVAVGTRRPTALSSVSIDDHAAAAAMTAYLIGLGHRCIGFIAGNAMTSVSDERLGGYRDALAAAGIGGDDRLVAPGDYTYRSGLAAAETLLAMAAPPTAIFASNDDMAAAALSTAHRRGLDVPRDLSVVGFDDTPVSSTVWPTMTTINQPIAAMSRAAVELLVEQIRARRSGAVPAPRRLCLAHALVLRDSVGVPRFAL